MLADNPKARPTASQLLRHSFFTSKELVSLLSFVESFSLKDEEEKVEDRTMGSGFARKHAFLTYPMVCLCPSDHVLGVFEPPD